MAGFKTAFGKGWHNKDTNPLFISPRTNFHLKTTSPAIDAGVLSDVYQTFYNLYGINISKDLDGAARPKGLAFDQDTYEVR